MDWKGLSTVDQKECFVRAALLPQANLSALCRTYGISRQTGYRWIDRYRHEGRHGLAGHSRAPIARPRALAPAWRERALTLRRAHGWGGRKIARVLQNDWGAVEVPSASTIDRWLAAAGLTKRRRSGPRYPPRSAPLGDVERPGQTYCADFKGEFLMQNGAYCYPLTVTDAHTRYLLGCYALPGALMEPSMDCFRRLFATHGVPERIRTDNGTPFASTGLARFSRLSVWWYALGITVEHIQPGRPDQNGRHERFHRTLKACTTNPPGTDLVDQQCRFDEFQHVYNTIRPHESLNMDRPADHFIPPTRTMPDTDPEFTYPPWYEVRTVKPNGLIWWRGTEVRIGKAFVGHRVGLQAIDTRWWNVYLGGLMLAQLDAQENRLLPEYPINKVANRRRRPA